MELKPCPFCGSTPKIKMDDRYPRPKCDRIDAYEVVCTNWNCIIGGVDDHYYRSPEEASKAWNRRAADAIEELSRQKEYWISVYDRFPPAEKEVYVTDGEYIARANLLDEVFPGDKPCWSYSGLGEITHWCEQIPLPLPPKEEVE